MPTSVRHTLKTTIQNFANQYTLPNPILIISVKRYISYIYNIKPT